MERNHVVVCKVINEVERINGRKKVHKIFYIAQALNHPIDHSFKWGNFGTYSPSLQNDLDMLVEHKIINQETVVRGEFKSFEYYLPECCGLDLEADEFDFSEKFIALIEKLNGEDTHILELWSSILYLQEQGETGEKLIMFLNHLKPQFTTDVIKNALIDVEALKQEFTEADPT